MVTRALGVAALTVVDVYDDRRGGYP